MSAQCGSNFTVKKEEPDLNVDVKLESELILDDETDNLTGSLQGFGCSFGTSLPQANQPVRVRGSIHVDSGKSISAVTKIKSEDIVLDLVPVVKVERIKEEVPSTESVLHGRWQVPPQVVPLTGIETSSCSSGEKLSIKLEEGITEDPVLQSQWSIPAHPRKSASSLQDGSNVKPEEKLPEDENPSEKPETLCAQDNEANVTARPLSTPRSPLSDPNRKSSVYGEPIGSVECNLVENCCNFIKKNSMQISELSISSSEQCSVPPEIGPSVQAQLTTIRNAQKFADRKSPDEINAENNFDQQISKYSGEQSDVPRNPKRLAICTKQPKTGSVTLSNDSRFPCEFCPRQFTFNSLLERHLLVHSDERPFTCQQCAAGFKRKCDLKIHSLSHSEERPFSCQQCSACFKYKACLNAHNLTHSNVRPFTCKQCQASFKSKRELNMHSKCHSNERPFSCKQCQASFKSKSYLTGHLRCHSNDRPFSCKQCQACFKSKTHLTTHLQCHSNERPFSCEQCPAAFKLKSSLTNHLRCHSNKRPFSCKQCQACFKSNYELAQHSRCHSNERPFSCQQCKASFKLKSHLTEHLRCHSDERPFSCEQCHAAFKMRFLLSNHLQRHSNLRPFSCKQCQARFKSNCELTAHLRVHSVERPFSCEHCLARFKRKKCIKVHMKAVHSI